LIAKMRKKIDPPEKSAPLPNNQLPDSSTSGERTITRTREKIDPLDKTALLPSSQLQDSQLPLRDPRQPRARTTRIDLLDRMLHLVMNRDKAKRNPDLSPSLSPE
jgi:hypothetical protein